ncbi:MAG: hypothetical protein JSS81_14480 [Acidobacteria bacterium]|nr:hypothetical protein [Acidobacteriota bacterium]
MKKLILWASIALLAGACGTSNETRNAVANVPAVNAPANSAPPAEPLKDATYTSGANPRDDLVSAAQKRQKVPFWSAKITSETTPGIDAEMQYVAPNRFHIKKAEGELIVIGNDAYSFENGKWQKSGETNADDILSQTKAGIEEGVRNLKDIKIARREKINGRDAAVYEYGAGGVTTRVWIAVDSGLELKNEVETTIAGKPAKQTTVYDYDRKVTIEAPKID